MPTAAPTSAHRNGRSAGGRRPAVDTGGGPQRRQRRVRVPELLLGLFLTAGCALAAVVWHTSRTERTPVLVVAAPIARGQVITAADLSAAQVNAEGIGLVPADRAAEFVGRIAAVDLSVGAPLTADVSAAVVPLGNGEALVGRSLAVGQYPAGLAAGDAVSVVMVADKALREPSSATATDASVPPGEQAEPARSAANAGSASGALPAEIVPKTASVDAVVESIELSPDGVGAIVNIRVDAAMASAIAAVTDVRLVQVG